MPRPHRSKRRCACWSQPDGLDVTRARQRDDRLNGGTTSMADLISLISLLPTTLRGCAYSSSPIPLFNFWKLTLARRLKAVGSCEISEVSPLHHARHINPGAVTLR